MRFRTLLTIGMVCAAAFAAAPVAADLVFTAPPRESGSKGDEVYAPIAVFMSKVTGQRVVYQHSDNWLSYQSNMQKGVYDIVFDGPHFIGWRMAKLDHVPLVKLPGNLAFVVIVKKGEERIHQLKDLAGRTLCAHAPPNLATLTTQFEFDNPARQPLIIETVGFPQAYKDMLAGKCIAAVMPVKIYEGLDKEGAAKIVFQSKPNPNQGFSAGPRVTPEMRDKLVQGLLSPEGTTAAKGLLERFKKDKFVVATREEYDGLGRVLKDVWGFDLGTDTAHK